MTAEFYFMALAGLGVSLAGFAGLITALDRRPEGHTPVAQWRIRNIVVSGFAVTFIGFGIIAAYTVTENEALTARLGSLAIAVFIAARTYVSERPGPAWPDDRQRRRTIAVNVVTVLIALGNVIVGGVGYLAFLMLILLAGPVSIFVFAVTSLTVDAKATDARRKQESLPDD